MVPQNDQMSRRARRTRSTGAALLAALGLVFASVPATDAYTDTPVSHAMYAYCQQPVISANCLHAAIADLDAARHKEGLGPIVLPTNFVHLSAPKQILVLTNIERIDRHLPPYAGLSSALDSIAQSAANRGVAPAVSTAAPHHGEWSRVSNSLLSDFLWMYTAGGSGRSGILMNVCGPLLQGAAIASGHSGSALFVDGSDTRDRADAFSWNAERAYFPAGSRERATAALPWVVRTSAPGFYRNNSWTIGIGTPGTYAPSATLHAQWYVDNVAQRGATSHQYTLSRAQHGHTVQVKIIAGRTGYMSCGTVYNFGRIA